MELAETQTAIDVAPPLAVIKLPPRRRQNRLWIGIPLMLGVIAVMWLRSTASDGEFGKRNGRHGVLAWCTLFAGVVRFPFPAFQTIFLSISPAEPRNLPYIISWQCPLRVIVPLYCRFMLPNPLLGWLSVTASLQ